VSERNLGARTFVFIIVVLILVGSFSQMAQASFMSYVDGSFRKLGRGVHNSIFAVGELPYRIREIYDSDGILAAGTSGWYVGLGRVVAREVVGLFETLTFFLPRWPKEGAILEPEFFFS